MEHYEMNRYEYASSFDDDDRYDAMRDHDLMYGEYYA